MNRIYSSYCWVEKWNMNEHCPRLPFRQIDSIFFKIFWKLSRLSVVEIWVFFSIEYNNILLTEDWRDEKTQVSSAGLESESTAWCWPPSSRSERRWHPPRDTTLIARKPGNDCDPKVLITFLTSDHGPVSTLKKMCKSAFVPYSWL